MIRVLHVTTVPMSLTFLKGHVPYMRERGIELHALSSPGPELDAFKVDFGVPTYAVPMARRVTPLRDLLAVRRMASVMREVKPDIVHAHTPKGGLLGMLAATLARVPVRIYHMRGLPFQGAKGAKKALLKSTERVACGLAHRVVAVSDSVRGVARKEGFCSADKLIVPANGSGQGVDAQRRFDPARAVEGGRQRRVELNIPEAAPVVGFVGRLVQDKGLLELERAWQKLRGEDPSPYLLLVGPWEGQDPVPAEVRARLEADPNVRFSGLDWDTPSLYAAMNVVVLPTYREGFPNVVLEAAAMGLPMVATRVTGCIDAVVDGQTGTLVPPQDDEAIAGAVRHYLCNSKVARQHGAAGRERVLRLFRPEQTYAAIHDLYLQLTETAKG